MYLYQFQIHIWAYIEKLDYGIWCCHVNRHMLVEKRVADVSPNIFPLFSCHPNNTHSQLQVSESELAVVPTPFLSPTQSQKKKKKGKKGKKALCSELACGREDWIICVCAVSHFLYFIFFFKFSELVTACSLFSFSFSLSQQFLFPPSQTYVRLSIIHPCHCKRLSFYSLLLGSTSALLLLVIYKNIIIFYFFS